jgi:hypothetical protein
VTRRLLLSLLILIFAGAAACPRKEPSPEACVQACTKLARLLSREGNKQGQEQNPALEANREEGRRNIDECARRCARDANEKHVACLERAHTIQEWFTCDDGHGSWF